MLAEMRPSSRYVRAFTWLQHRSALSAGEGAPHVTGCRSAGYGSIPISQIIKAAKVCRSRHETVRRRDLTAS